MNGLGSYLKEHGRHRFLRGLAVLLPSVLTIWLLLAAFQFVQDRIAEPINRTMREVVVRYTELPRVTEAMLIEQRREILNERSRRRVYQALPSERREAWLHAQARRARLDEWWDAWSWGLSLIGLVLAVAGIYAAGLLLGNFVGRRLYERGEMLVRQVPLIGRLYPGVKQVTDFVVGEDVDAASFSRVVAVQYPRKGIWCIGLATGGTLATIEQHLGQRSVTVFVPSAPLPFTGYIISVAVSDVLELPINIEDTAKFLFSGGVLVPPTQLIERKGEWVLRDATGKELTLDEIERQGGKEASAAQ